MIETKYDDDRHLTFEDVDRIDDRHRFFPYMTSITVASLEITVREFETLVVDLCQVQSVAEELRAEWAILDTPSTHWMDALLAMGFGNTYMQVITEVLLREDPVAAVPAHWERFSTTDYIRIFMAEVFRQDRKAHLYGQRFANDFAHSFFKKSACILKHNVILRASVVGGTDPRRVRTMAAFVCEQFQYCRQLFWIRSHMSRMGLNDMPQKLGKVVAEEVRGSPNPPGPMGYHYDMLTKMSAAALTNPDHVKAIIEAFRNEN